MNIKSKIVDVNLNNISSYPARCLMSPKDRSYEYKKEWLEKRFSEGLKIKQLYMVNMHGEQSMRGGIYLFIVCGCTKRKSGTWV